MSEIFDDRRKALEEEYFRRKERETLDRLREQMAAEAAAAGKEPARQCPLGHGALAEVRQDDVAIDRCDTCGGVWLDAGELELLTKSPAGGGWFSRLTGK
jgi:uncharacterized protein